MADGRTYFFQIVTGEHNPDGSVKKIELDMKQMNMDYGDYVTVEDLLTKRFLTGMVTIAKAAAKQKGAEVYDIDAIEQAMSAGAAARRG